jgi:hypothetical protein
MLEPLLAPAVGQLRSVALSYVHVAHFGMTRSRRVLTQSRRRCKDRRVLQLLVLALVAAGIVLAGCGGTAGDDGNASITDDGNASITARLPAASLAEKLATRDERWFRCAVGRGCARSPGEPAAAVVVDFDTQLLNLVFKCKEDRLSLEDRLRLLADYTVKARKLLAKQGMNESLVGIISDVNRSIPYGAPRQPCSDVFDAYVTFVSRGRPGDVPLQTGG